MPIKIPDLLPAQDVLSNENIFVMSESRATNQDIRPLHVGILNLMPDKIETEVQLLRMLSNTPLQVNVDLIRIDNRAPKTTPQVHMDTFYRSFSEVKDKKYDGLIVTGAPLGLIDYKEVEYWDTIEDIFNWTRTHVQSTLFLCWAVHAAMYHFYGVDRSLRARKLSGVYHHGINQLHDELTRGFDNDFWAPHSRYGEISVDTYHRIPELNVLAESEEAGAYLVASEDKRLVFVTGHPEYTPVTLHHEYCRDVTQGLNPDIPINYYPDNDPDKSPMVKWRAHGNLLFSNWLNYYVYQITPYELSSIS